MQVYLIFCQACPLEFLFCVIAVILSTLLIFVCLLEQNVCSPTMKRFQFPEHILRSLTAAFDRYHQGGVTCYGMDGF